MKLATTIGEMYDFTASPADAVRMYKDSGFKYLDYSFYRCVNPGSVYLEESDLNWKKEIADAAKAAADLGFTFVQAHAPAYNPDRSQDHRRELRSVIRSIEGCAELGITKSVIHTAISPENPYPDGMKKYMQEAREYMEKLLPYAEKYNVTLCVENSCTINTGNGCFFMTGAEMCEFLKEMNHPNLAACWDVGHAQMQGCSIYDEIVTLGSNLGAVHIHDNNGRSDQHLAPHCGVIDFDAIVKAMIDIKFSGYFCFECDYFIKYGSIASHPTPEVKSLSAKLLYEIGKALLEKQNCFEE